MERRPQPEAAFLTPRRACGDSPATEGEEGDGGFKRFFWLKATLFLRVYTCSIPDSASEVCGPGLRRGLQRGIPQRLKRSRSAERSCRKEPPP